MLTEGYNPDQGYMLVILSSQFLPRPRIGYGSFKEYRFEA